MNLKLTLPKGVPKIISESNNDKSFIFDEKTSKIYKFWQLSQIMYLKNLKDIEKQSLFYYHSKKAEFKSGNFLLCSNTLYFFKVFQI